MKFLNNVDLQKNEIQNFRVHNLAEAPANPVVGQHYFNTTTNTEYVWDGSKWIDALSQGDYTFINGIAEDDNRNVGLTAATTTAIGGVIVGSNIDVNNGTISVKDATNAQKGLIQIATDAEAATGTNETKAVNAKQVEAQIQADIADKIELTDLSATGPVLYNDATGVISGDFDAAPTENSNKFISSGAVFANEVSDVEAKANAADTFVVTKAGVDTEITINDVAHAVKADQDEDGNNIKSTYATKAEVADDITLADLSATAPITYNDATGVISAEFDTVPTADSNKLMKSKDIKAALEELGDGAVKNVALKAETTDTITVTKGDDTSADIKIAKVDEAASLTGVTASAAELNILDGATLTTDELNYVDGVTSNIQTQLDAKVDRLETKPTAGSYTKVTINAEGQVTAGANLAEADIPELHLAKITDVTATAAEVSELHEAGAVKADFVKLHGLTATAAELNEIHESGVEQADLAKLHAVTVTAAQINAIAEVDADDLAKLADITATAEEINVLDGITATTAQLNKAANLDNCDAADLTKLHDITVTAAEINNIVNKIELTDLSAVGPITYNNANGEISATFDNAPTDDSNNLVKSGAIKAALDDKVDSSLLGVANGVATLDENGLVPAAQLPSYVDDIIDLLAIGATAPATCAKGDKYFNTTSKKVFTATAANTWGAEGKDPEADKIYVNLENNMAYRWSGTAMVQIGADKLLGFNGTIEGDGTTSTFNINHNLGTRNVVFEIYEAASPYEKVYVQVLHTSLTQLQVVFGTAPAVGDNYNITVIAIG